VRFALSIFDGLRNMFSSLSPVPRSQSESALTSDIAADPTADPASGGGSGESSNFTLPPEAFGKSLAAGVIYSFQLPAYLPKFFHDAPAPPVPVAATAPSPVEGEKAGSGSQKHVKKALKPQQAIAAPPAPLTLPKRRALHPRELLLVDTQGRVYLSAEIFGLGAMNESDSGEYNTNGPAPSAAADVTAAPETSGMTTGKGYGQGSVQQSPTVVLPNSGVNATRVLPTAAGSTNRDTGTDSYIASTNGSSSTAGGELQGEQQQGADAATAATADAAPVVVSSLNAAQGGKYLHEECVVCLTDPKEVLLLPCRHLCVCYGCFAFVDKCPVCRAFFEEYLRIEINTKVNVGGVASRQALL
jgi:hypothetical protein